VEERVEPELEPRVVPELEPRVVPELEPRVVPELEPRVEQEQEERVEQEGDGRVDSRSGPTAVGRGHRHGEVVADIEQAVDVAVIAWIGEMYEWAGELVSA
jgi:hypothetical protein